MSKRLRILTLGGGATLMLAALIVALTVGGAAGKGGPPKGKPAPKGSIEFFVTATEFEGEHSTEKFKAPSVDPEDLSDGYEFEAPGKANPKEPDEWEVASYGWNPGFMLVHRGDTVALRIFVVAGKHKTWVEAPNGDTAVKEHVMIPGREYLKVFKASQLGIYHLKCDNHDPTMTANIVVLP